MHRAHHVCGRLESTDAVGRVPHPSPTRDAASNPIARASVPLLNLFFSRICVDSARFAPNRADLARIGLYWPTTETTETG